MRGVRRCDKPLQVARDKLDLSQRHSGRTVAPIGGGRIAPDRQDSAIILDYPLEIRWSQKNFGESAFINPATIQQQIPVLGSARAFESDTRDSLQNFFLAGGAPWIEQVAETFSL
jgi:hypothetical protein